MSTTQQDKAFERELINLFGGDCSWVVDFVRNNFTPEQVFESDILEEWADESNLVEELREQIKQLEDQVEDLESALEDNG